MKNRRIYRHTKEFYKEQISGFNKREETIEESDHSV